MPLRWHTTDCVDQTKSIACSRASLCYNVGLIPLRDIRWIFVCTPSPMIIDTPGVVILL